MENIEHCYKKSMSAMCPLIVNWGIFEDQTRKIDKGKEEPPEKMLRSMQGAFCKGRYRSWILSEMDASKTSKKSGNRNKPRRKRMSDFTSRA